MMCDTGTACMRADGELATRPRGAAGAVGPRRDAALGLAPRARLGSRRGVVTGVHGIGRCWRVTLVSRVCAERSPNPKTS